MCTSEWLLNKIFNCLNQCIIQPYSTSHQKRFCILAPIFLVKAVWMHGFGLCTLYPISTQYCWMCFKLVLYTGIIFKIQIFKTIILAHCHVHVCCNQGRIRGRLLLLPKSFTALECDQTHYPQKGVWKKLCLTTTYVYLRMYLVSVSQYPPNKPYTTF